MIFNLESLLSLNYNPKNIMKKIIFIATILLPMALFAQTDLSSVIKAGEVVLSGFTIFKSAKSDTNKDSKIVSSVCIKNKLEEKITLKMLGKDESGNEVKKELVVQNDGKECVFNIPKGIYTYEVTLSNKDIYKKGEYRFDDDVVITIKKSD
jgi:hypothetical protein